IGLAVALTLDPKRLGLAAKLVWLAAAPVAALSLAYHSAALTRPRSDLAGAVHDGRRLAVWVLVLGAVSAGAALVLPALGRELQLSDRAHRVVGWTVVLGVAGLIGVTAAHDGGSRLVERAHRSFTARPPRVDGSLNARLFSLSNNGRIALWRTAWQDHQAHP